MFNQEKYNEIIRAVTNANAQMVVITKNRSIAEIKSAYAAGQRVFGESYLQELLEKKDQLPDDIEWHMIGHVQRNKVRALIACTDLIHSVDSYRLLKEIDKRAKEKEKKMNILLQINSSQEKQKYGFSYEDLPLLLDSTNFERLKHVRVCGLMGMAKHTDDVNQITEQFQTIADFFKKIKKQYFNNVSSFEHLSIGMSNDYHIALEQGATMVRIGSAVFQKNN